MMGRVEGKEAWWRGARDGAKRDDKMRAVQELCAKVLFLL